MTNDLSDRDFAERAMKRLPLAGEPGLERKLLAGYDAWNKGRIASASAWLGRLARVIWPGAPVWAPISAFAVALLLGAGLGTALPGLVREEQPLFSLEQQPSSFGLLAPDASQEDF